MWDLLEARQRSSAGQGGWRAGQRDALAVSRSGLGISPKVSQRGPLGESGVNPVL